MVLIPPMPRRLMHHNQMVRNNADPNGSLAEAATARGLPLLTGSRAQIAFANAVRDWALANHRIDLETAKKHRVSKWWLDHADWRNEVDRSYQSSTL